VPSSKGEDQYNKSPRISLGPAYGAEEAP
jgi:hypothetical protein